MIAARTIAEVKARTDLVALIAEHVPSLKRRGSSHVGLCPFHAEKSPSFSVHRERGFFHCFGCKESGGAIDFLIKLEGYTFPEAVRALAERLGVEVEEEDERPEQRREQEQRRKELADLHAVMQLAAVFYETQLREHPQREHAIAALRERDLAPGSDEQVQNALDAFRIGYAPPGWDELCRYLRSHGVHLGDAERAGLVCERTGGGHFDRFRHRLMFAICDVHGRVIAFSGRALPALPGDVRDEKPAKYINSPESPIYHKGQQLFGLFQARHAVRKQGCALLVEGNFDVVALHARGFGHAVAPLGTAFTVDQAKLLRRYAEQALLLFDGDAAGQKAVAASREPLLRAGLAAKVAILPAGHDPDSLLRERGEAAVSALLSSARGLRETLIEQALDERFSQADVLEKKARVDRVLKLLAEEDDPLVRATLKSLADTLAGRLDIRDQSAFSALEQAVKRALRAQQRPQSAAADPRRARVVRKPRGSLERAAMIGALPDFPALLLDPEVEGELELLEGASAQTALALRRQLQGERLADAAALLEQIPEAARAFVAARLASPEHESAEVAKGNLLANAKRLRSRLSEDEHQETVRQQRRVGGDWEAAVALAAQAQARKRRQHGI